MSQNWDAWRPWSDVIYRTQDSLELRNLLASGINRWKYVKLHISVAAECKRETVEFREHRGTMDAVEISWWVVFIERVINFAWNTTDCGYRFFRAGQKPWGIVDIEEMWDFVGLSEEGREYFRSKIREYRETKVSGWSDSLSDGLIES